MLPVLNGERFLDEAIGSIVTQDFRDLEFILVDDASTDGSLRILEQWAARDSRLVVLRNEQNLGASASLNRALAVARGEYIARQDADDVSEPGRLRAEVEVLDAHRDVVLVSMNYHVIDERGTILQTTRRDHPPEVVEYLLHFSNAIGGHTQVMYRRDAILAAGGYSAELRASLDYELWTRLIRHGRFLVLPQAGMRYRLHDDRITVRDGAYQRHESWSATHRMLTSYLGRTISDDELRAVATTWRRSVSATRPDLAHAIAREAYDVFTRDHASSVLQRSAREATATRFAETAMTLLRHLQVRHALRHVAYSLQWDRRSVFRVVGRALRSPRFAPVS